MLAVQYNTVQNPAERETRDVWAIRKELAEEQKQHSELLSSIRTVTEVVNKYEDTEFDNPELLLEQSVEQLRKQAGVMPLTGPGVTLLIEPSPELLQFGYEIEPIAPELLIRLINDLNRYNAEAIEIGGQRVTFKTAIRDINGQTMINSEPIANTYIEMKIITQTLEQAERLSNYLLASTFRDEFYVDNLQLTIYGAQQILRINSTVEGTKSEYLIENKGD